MDSFDLHFHSTYSDGKKTVAELAKEIKKQKLKYCALTDHNTVDGIRELKAGLVKSGIQVIHGVELTTKYGDDEVHVLAYDFDIDAAAKVVRERNELVRVQKLEEMTSAIALSVAEGFEVTAGLVPVEKQPVTLTLALDICARASNQALFKERHGKILIPEEVYWEYQAPEKSCAVSRSGVSVEWIVEKFKGVAKDLIIAHPFVPVSVVVKALDEARIVDLLGKGLTGVEVYHNKTSADQIKLLKRIVGERSLHFSGGSDHHGRKDDSLLGQYGPDTPLPDFKLFHFFNR